jgi:hypothetical protein
MGPGRPTTIVDQRFFCDSLLYSSLASIFCRVVLQQQEPASSCGVIGVVATVSQREKLHPMLLPSRGCHFIHHVVNLPTSQPDVLLLLLLLYCC